MRAHTYTLIVTEFDGSTCRKPVDGSTGDASARMAVECGAMRADVHVHRLTGGADTVRYSVTHPDAAAEHGTRE